MNSEPVCVAVARCGEVGQSCQSGVEWFGKLGWRERWFLHKEYEGPVDSLTHTHTHNYIYNMYIFTIVHTIIHVRIHT